MVAKENAAWEKFLATTQSLMRPQQRVFFKKIKNVVESAYRAGYVAAMMDVLGERLMQSLDEKEEGN